MSEHLTPGNLARYRDLAQKAKKETFEPGWPYDGTGDWTGCVDGMLGGITGEFAGAMSPDVVLALLDELDEKERQLRSVRHECSQASAPDEYAFALEVFRASGLACTEFESRVAVPGQCHRCDKAQGEHA